MMKVVKISLVLMGMLLMGACGNKTTNAVDEKDSIDTVQVENVVQDSTLYGVACDCGMSTFNLALENGDTIYTSRMSESGVDGVIYGDLNLDDRFCMIATDDNSSLVSAINLTQLDIYVGDYKILNGALYLNNQEEPVKIVELSSQVFVYEDAAGQHALKNKAE